MKRKFTLLIAALALLTMIVQPGRAWADEASFAPSDFSGQGTSGTGSAISATVSGVTFACNKGYGTTQIRCYSGGKITISSSNTITEISFTFSGSYTGGLSTSYTGLSTTSWEQTLSSQARIMACTVTYTASGGNTPSLSVNPAAVNFGSKAMNPAEPYSETFTVTYAYLTENLTINVGSGLTGVSVSPQEISKDGDGSQIVTVYYYPTTEGEISGNITVSNTADELSKTVAVSGSSYNPASAVIYERYTGNIVEGDYIIYNTNGAMKNELNNGPRFNNQSVTVNNNQITNPDPSIIWHIAADGNYWTIYNEAVQKYAAGTTYKNQGALLSTVDDHARWIITYASSNFTIENYGRSQDNSDPNNRYLRQNTTASSGWATYSNGTGYVPTLYKKAGPTTYKVTYNANGATSGTVPVDATQYETNASVTVADNTGNLAKAGYVWAGWCMNAEGTGTVYGPDYITTFEISANTTLYAKWEAKTITGLTCEGTPTGPQYAGQAFNPEGLTVTATFNDASQEDVTSQVVWTPNELSIATTSVTGTYMGQQVTVDGITVTYAPGTENNPYTVAQARAAIDAGTGITGVYATGTVSEIVTAYNPTYGNISYNISTDGTTTADQLQAYRGKSYNGEWFTSADDIQVGDIVIVYGNLKKYNTTYEFDQDNRLVSLIRKVANPTFSPVAGAVPAGTGVTIACTTDGATIYYTTDGSDPTTSSSVYSEPIVINATVTIKAFAHKEDGSPDSDVVTAAYTIAEPVATPTFSPAAGTYNFAQSVTISCETSGSTIRYTIDGTDPSTSSAVYSEPIAVNETMTIKAIGVKEGLANSAVASAAYTMNIPVINASNVNLAYDATYGSIAYTLTNEVEGGVLTAVRTEGDWLTVGEVSAESVALTCTANEGEADRTATVTLTYNYETHTVTEVVTVTQAHFIVDYATLPFEFDGGRADIATTIGLTQEGLDKDYASSPKLKFDGTGDWVILKINERPGTLTFDINGNSFSGGTFKVQTSADGETYTDLQSYTDLGTTQHESFTNLGESVRYIKWIYTEKSSGNVGLGNIALAEYVAPVPSIAISPATINEVPCYGGGGLLEVTYTNMGDNPNPSVIECDSEGNATDYDWLTAELVNGNANINGTIAANDSTTERTAYLKVWGTDANSETVCSNIVSITQLGYPTITTAELPFTFDGDDEAIATTYGIVQAGLGSSYGDSPKLKFKETGSFVILHFDETPGILTYDIQGDEFNGTFKVQASADNVTYTDLKVYTSSNLTSTKLNESFDDLASTVRYIKWVYTEATSGKVRLGNIGLTDHNPAIIPATYAINVDAGEHTDELAVTYQWVEEDMAEVVICDAEGNETTYDWFTAEVNTTDYNVTYIIGANATTSERKAYFIVRSVYSEINIVDSDIVTVTQEGSVALYTITFNTNGGTFDGNADFGGEIVQKQAGTYELPSAQKDNVTFAGWLLNGTETIYEAGAQYEVTGNASFTAQWNSAMTGLIEFGTADGHFNFNANNTTGLDNLENTWTVTVVGTTSYTTNAEYIQVGSKNNPATSITFTTTLPSEANITAFSAKFGGNNDTAGHIDLIVGETTVGEGTLNATEDVTVTNTSTASGTILTVTVTNIARGVKCYYISYTYVVNTDPYITIANDEIEVPAVGDDDYIAIAYGNLEIGQASDFAIQFYDDEDNEITCPSWITTAEVTTQSGQDGYFVHYVIGENSGTDDRSAYFKVWTLDDDIVYSNLVTITQAAPAQTYMVMFELDGGDFVQNSDFDDVIVEKEAGTYNLPSATKDGFNFAGWNDDESTYEADASYTVSGDVTFTAQWTAIPVGVTYTLVETANDLVPGLHYIIAGNNKGEWFAMGVQNSNNRAAVSITVNDNVATVTSDDVYDFVISGDSNENGWTIYDESTESPGYLYAASSGSNHLKTRANNNDGNSQWDITFDNSVASIVAQGSYTRNVMQFNTSNTLFACYGSASQSAVYLYKKNGDTDPVYYSPTIVEVENPNADAESIVILNNEIFTYTGTLKCSSPDHLVIHDGGQLIHGQDVLATLLKDYEAAPWPSSKSVSGWYTIASPVDGGDLSAVVSNVTNYDFFAYDEAAYTWRNQKVPANNINAFEQGIGYLYATAAAKQGSFAGTMKATNATIEKDLSYACTLESLKGFNLMGNPFTRNLTSADVEIDGTALTNYYVVEGGSELEVRNIADNPIKPGQGFMVQATAENQTLVFNPGTGKGRSANNGYISLAVSNESFNDMAYINIANGNTLRKMTLNADSPKVYVMNDNKDYAAARVESLSGSMPVCFQTNNIGSYTITVKANELDVEYLHLIDNVTHEDIDLLFDSSYTFVASGHDNAARFTLVFRANANIDELEVSDSFAYQSGDVIIVNGEGTLQVFDVMGRFVRSININGSESINASEFSTGVYVFRMVGDEVKAQKVVIR